MKKIGSYILIVAALNFNVAVAGDCAKDVQMLNEGDTAPCKGYLFSPKKELEIRVKIEESKLTEEELKLKNKQVDRLKKDILDVEDIIKKEREKAELWRNHAESATKELIKNKNSRSTRDWIFLLIGVGLTVGAGAALGAVAR